MKSIMLLILLTPLFLMASQRTLQYRDGRTSVQLPVALDRITVMVDSSRFTNWESILTSDASIDPSKEPEKLWGGFYVVHLSDGVDPLSVVAHLNSRPDVAFAYPVFSNPRGEDVYITNHVVVHFNDAVSLDQIDSIRSARGLISVLTLFRNPRYQVFRLSAHDTALPLDIATEISVADMSVNSFPSFILPLKPNYDPDDTYWTNQWYFKNTGQFGGPAGVDIDLDGAFDYAIAGIDTLLIAILDDGFEEHPDFPWSRVAHAWDYSTMDSTNSGDSDVSPSGSSHGVAVTGIIAATTNNATGLSGVVRPSERIRIIAHKIFMDGPFGGPAPEWVVARAIEDAVDLGAAVMSCSWSGSTPSGWYAIYDALTYADFYGTVVVFAAGNDTSWVNFPSDHPTVLAVGATDSLDHQWTYSNFGPELDVMAPSASIDGSWGNFWIIDRQGSAGYSSGTHGCGGVDPDYNCRFAGTSAACPQVSGIAALILLRRPDLRSIWWNNHTEQMRKIIRYSSERAQFDTLAPPDDTSRVDDNVGWGRVNADRALMAVARGDANNDGSVDISDIVYLIAYIHSGGADPRPHKGVGDANCDGSVNIADVVYLINRVFNGGPPPMICYHYSY
jgi:hypothetical protein